MTVHIRLAVCEQRLWICVRFCMQSLSLPLKDGDGGTRSQSAPLQINSFIPHPIFTKTPTISSVYRHPLLLLLHGLCCSLPIRKKCTDGCGFWCDIDESSVVKMVEISSAVLRANRFLFILEEIEKFQGNKLDKKTFRLSHKAFTKMFHRSEVRKTMLRFQLATSHCLLCKSASWRREKWLEWGHVKEWTAHLHDPMGTSHPLLG